MQPDMKTAAPDKLAEAIESLIDDWERGRKVARLWDGDAALWTGACESRWLGWLRAPEIQRGAVHALEVVAPAALDGAFDDVVVLGMGGSSLCPDVLRSCFGPQPGAPRLHVLDTTVPAQIRALDRRLNPERTLFVASSKSGTTLETDLLLRHFLARVRSHSAGPAGQQFVAVTDPGSPLAQVAADREFRAVFHGTRSIGGRYSALSPFGLVPAAAMGLDVRRLLDRASAMCARCGPAAPVRDNPGAVLGLVLAAAANDGRDKVTLAASARLAAIGAWVEQLLAESTGKEGTGLVPVDGESLTTPARYRADRLFVYLRDAAGACADQDAAIARIERAGHPVVRIDIADLYDLGGEFYRWEMAAAVAGAVLGINPFDQPDVEASKAEARRLTAAFERKGALPDEAPAAVEPEPPADAQLLLYADPATVRRLVGGGHVDSAALARLVSAHCASLGAGDYAALLAYIEPCVAHLPALQRLRRLLRDATGAATCLGFGPRYLHSTGQLHKGGRNSGVFVVITADDDADLTVPGQRVTFGAVKAAQAQGDAAVLRARARRVIRVHIRGSIDAGLERLADIVERAVGGL